MMEAEIRERFAIWQGRLGLQNWRIEIDFVDNPLEFQQHSSPAVVDFMVTEPDWRYSRARILINVHALGQAEDDWIEESIVHELTHCLLAPLEIPEWVHLQVSADTIHAHMTYIEMVTTNVSRRFLALYERRDALRNLSRISYDAGMYEPESETVDGSHDR